MKWNVAKAGEAESARTAVVTTRKKDGAVRIMARHPAAWRCRGGFMRGSARHQSCTRWGRKARDCPQIHLHDLIVQNQTAVILRADSSVLHRRSPNQARGR